jgi:hypothetical protein
LEVLLDEIDRLLDRSARREGPKISSSIPTNPSHQCQFGKWILNIQPQIEVGLVILQIDVVSRLESLDEIIFKNKGLLFRVGHKAFNISYFGNEESHKKSRV